MPTVNPPTAKTAASTPGRSGAPASSDQNRAGREFDALLLQSLDESSTTSGSSPGQLETQDPRAENRVVPDPALAAASVTSMPAAVGGKYPAALGDASAPLTTSELLAGDIGVLAQGKPTNGGEPIGVELTALQMATNAAYGDSVSPGRRHAQDFKRFMQGKDSVELAQNFGVKAQVALPISSAFALGDTATSSTAMLNLDGLAPAMQTNGLFSIPGSFNRVEATPVESVGSHGLTLNEQVGSQSWIEETGQKVILLFGEGKHHAELKLNPEALGPIEVQITLDQDQVSVFFAAAHGQTKDALEAALPRLKELFAERGIELAQAFVGSERQPRRDPGTAASAPSDPSNPLGGGAAVADGQRMVYRLDMGNAIDLFV